MSTMPTTVGRVSRAAILELLLAVSVAALLGFILGFGSQALGSELRASEAIEAGPAAPEASPAARPEDPARSRR